MTHVSSKRQMGRLSIVLHTPPRRRGRDWVPTGTASDRFEACHQGNHRLLGWEVPSMVLHTWLRVLRVLCAAPCIYTLTGIRQHSIQSIDRCCNACLAVALSQPNKTHLHRSLQSTWRACSACESLDSTAVFDNPPFGSLVCRRGRLQARPAYRHA